MDLPVHGTSHAGGKDERRGAESLSGRPLPDVLQTERPLYGKSAGRENCRNGEAMPDHIPPFMARVTDVTSMLRLIGSREKKVLYLKIKDPIVERNNGYFCWTTAPEESTAEWMEEVPERIDLELTIGELTSFLFEGMKICLSESV